MHKAIVCLVVMFGVACAGSPSTGTTTAGLGTAGTSNATAGASSGGRSSGGSGASSTGGMFSTTGTGGSSTGRSIIFGRTSGGSGGDGSSLTLEEACAPISEGIANAYQQCQTCDAGCVPSLTVQSQTVPMCEAWLQNCDGDAGDFTAISGVGTCLEGLTCLPGLMPGELNEAIGSCWAQFGSTSPACYAAAIDEENDAGL